MLGLPPEDTVSPELGDVGGVGTAVRLPVLGAAELARLTVTVAGLPEGDPGLF